MRKKISEKSLLFSIVCLFSGIVIFAKTQLMATPIRVSEIGVLVSVAAVGLLFYGICLFKKSFVRI